LGDFEKGDPLLSKAVESFEAAIVNLPRYKQNYTRRLKNILLEYAQFKRAAGENEAGVVDSAFSVAVLPTARTKKTRAA
jgi:hypothetical protein